MVSGQLSFYGLQKNILSAEQYEEFEIHKNVF